MLRGTSLPFHFTSVFRPVTRYALSNSDAFEVSDLIHFVHLTEIKPDSHKSNDMESVSSRSQFQVQYPNYAAKYSRSQMTCDSCTAAKTTLHRTTLEDMHKGLTADTGRSTKTQETKSWPTKNFRIRGTSRISAWSSSKTSDLLVTNGNTLTTTQSTF